MAKLDRKPTFSTQKVDAEHRELVEIIERISEHDTPITDLLGDLYVILAKHFAYEEAIMRTRCFDDYEKCQADHQRMLHEITTAMFDHRNELNVDGHALAKRLYGSLCDHLVTHRKCLHTPENPLAQVR